MLKRHTARKIIPVLAMLLSLLAAFVAPAASAASTYDITQVGDASFVSVKDSNGRELSRQTTGSDGIRITATIHLDIDDMETLQEGDVVQVKTWAKSGSHFGPNLFSRATLPSSLLDRQGNAVFTVSNADGNTQTLTLTRTGTAALGAYSCDLVASNILWRWTAGSKTSTWGIGKSSTYTFASWPLSNSPCTGNSSGRLVPSVRGGTIEVNNWFANCATMRALLDGKDTSGFKTGSQVGWMHVIPESGGIDRLDARAGSAFVLKAIDGKTPSSVEEFRTGVLNLSWKKDVDISTYEKAAENLPVGSVTAMRLDDGSYCFAYNVGSRLPGLDNSLKTPDSSDPTTLELQRGTGNIWQMAQVVLFVRFADETIPNKVSVETQGTESAYQTTTLTTKPADPAIGAGQSAIRYDPNGGDGTAFRKVGDPGTAATTAEVGVFLRQGYTFAGWNTAKDGTGTSYAAGAAVAYPAEGDTLTLYAQWKANTYKVEFKDWLDRTITSGTADYGTTPTAPALSDTTWLADPDMNFDNVDGWHKAVVYGGSFEFTKDGLATRTRDLYGPSKKPFDGMVHIELRGDASKANGDIGAGWHEIGSTEKYEEWGVCGKGQTECAYDGYSIPVKGNAIETWLQINSTDDKGYGELLARHMQLTQVDPTTHNGVARDGYVFTGWDRDVTKPVTGDTVYTARYRPAVYKVRFDANGGKGTMSDQSHTYDRKQALTANAFTREGYRFTGWNTRRDSKGKAFTDKQTVTNLLAHDGAVGVLYAQWERIPENALPRSGGTMTHNLTTILGGGASYPRPSIRPHAPAQAGLSHVRQVM